MVCVAWPTPRGTSIYQRVSTDIVSNSDPNRTALSHSIYTPS